MLAAMASNAVAATPAGTAPSAAQLPHYAPGGRPTSYVSIGDSYAAGQGVLPRANPLTTSRAVDGCKQSTINYPRLIARDFNGDAASGMAPLYPGNPFSYFVDASCSRADTTHLRDPEVTSANGLVKNPAQLSALRANDTGALVTLSLGINDIGLINYITNCANQWELFQTRYPGNQPCATKNKLDAAAGADQALATKVTSVANKLSWNIADIRTRAPAARVAVVGYPAILPPVSAATASTYPAPTFPCGDNLKLAIGDIAFFSDIEARLNEVMRATAAKYGVSFVDVRAQAAGHDACAAPTARWVEPYHGFTTTGNSSEIAMHPNAAGQGAIRKYVERVIPKSVW